MPGDEVCNCNDGVIEGAGTNPVSIARIVVALLEELCRRNDFRDRSRNAKENSTADSSV